jgi:uncharacterized protein (TIGR03083 family)
MTVTLTPIRMPRRPALNRVIAMRLAADEYQRYLQVLHELSDDDWTQPTDCPGWDVRSMAGHNLGMAEMAASIREGVRQQIRASKRPGIPIDALTGLQVEERAHLTPQQLIRRYEAAAPQAARGRQRVPAFLRNRTFPEPSSSTASRSGGWSASCSTRSSPVTPGCTASTPLVPSVPTWC